MPEPRERSLPAPRRAPGVADLIRRHQGAVWRHLRWLGAEPEEADDLAQEVFLVLLGRAFDERADAATRAFLRATAVNLWRDERRREGRRVDTASLEAATAAFEAHEERRGERLDALLGCIARLGERSRQVLDWHYRDQLDRGQIAARLGMKPNGVKTKLQRVRAALRECVERRMEEER